MSTRKYVILIVLGLVLLAGLSATFVHLYNKKNQTTSALEAIPSDAAAIIRLNHPLQFFTNDTTSNLFSGVENPQIRAFIEKLSLTNEFGKILTSPMLVSFHTIGKDRLEPLLILRSNEEFSSSKILHLLQQNNLKIAEIEYNGKPLYTCTYPNGYIIYLYHYKGITCISPSLILLETSVRKLDSNYPTDVELQNVINLTSSTSNASIAINTKLITPWLKQNFFSAEADWATAINQTCSWIVLDYQQATEEITFSGMLTNSTQNRLIASNPKVLLTPSLITENTAFSLENIYEKFSSKIAPKYKPDSVKFDIRNLIAAVNPDRTIIQHLSIPRNDSAGFIAILYPHNTDSTRYLFKHTSALKNVQADEIAELKFDSTGVKLSNLLGNAYGLVTPRYMLMEGNRIMLSSSKEVIMQFQKEQKLLSMRSNNPATKTWNNKITPNGVAALYINPNLSEKMTKTLFSQAIQGAVPIKAFKKWNGLGVMLTPSGNNLLISGYMGRKAEKNKEQFCHKVSTPNLSHTLLTLSKGKSLLIIAHNDTITALDGKLNKQWNKKIGSHIDSIFTINLPNQTVAGTIAGNTVYFLNDKGAIVSLFSFSNTPKIIAAQPLRSPSNEIAIVDKSNTIYMVNPLGKDSPKRLFRLSYKPATILLISTNRKQTYIAASRNDKTEIYNTKGSIIRRIAFDLRKGKAIYLDRKMLLFSAERAQMVNSQFAPITDKMTAHFSKVQDLKDGLIGDNHTIFLLGNNFVEIVSKDFSEKLVAKTTSEPTYIQPIDGKYKGIMVVDIDRNVYLFSPSGKLHHGFPFNIKDATYVIPNPDGTLFAISLKGNTFSSTKIDDSFATLL